MNPVYQLFVYGSLRNDGSRKRHPLTGLYFTLAGQARVRGKLYDLGEYPGARPTTENAFIKGELYTLTDPARFAAAMQQLDVYEEVNTEAAGEGLYRRELTEVLTGNNTVPAWIYWYNGTIEGKTLIASGDAPHRTGQTHT